MIDWLLDSDPALRWQVLRDVVGASTEEVAGERDRVATEGLGARLLALQGDDGSWGGVPWNRGWDSTMHVLMLLRDLGLDPASEPARSALERVRDGVHWWDDASYPFFGGETEPCINGQVAAAGAYFDQDVSALIGRLLGEQLDDGGWNCEAENGSVRSSFDTTITVLDGLLAVERTTGTVQAARRAGEEYLLERGLFRRLSTGGVVRPEYLDAAFPYYWHYDVLRALDYFRAAGGPPDHRMAEAVEIVRAKRRPDGRWPLDRIHPGRVHFALDAAVGEPSRWNTLRALRVLAWWDRA
jgi:hypothetical protein